MTEQSTLFARNLALLRKHHPEAARILDTRPSPPPPARVEPAADGRPNLLCATPGGSHRLLHQPDPGQEASSYLAHVPEDSHGTVALFGLGLGYVALAILAQRPDVQQMLVVERSTGLFRRAMELVDLSPLLADPRLVLLLDPDHPAIQQAIERMGVVLQLEDIHILRHLPSFSLDPGYAGLHDQIFVQLNAYNVAGNSAMHQARHFLTGRLNNIAALPHCRPIDALAGAIRGRPALLIANGPSLDDHLDLLRRHRDRAVYFAVDSAVPALLRHGIVPDYIGALDANPVIYEKLAPVAGELGQCALITACQATPEMVNYLPVREIFLMFGPDATDGHFAPLAGATPWPENTPTVAHLNLLAALAAGADPIVFVGQDFAYTDPKNTHSSATRLTCNELVEELSGNRDDFVTIAGVNNTRVQTDRGLLNAKELLEEFLRRKPHRYINATSRGARIAGTEELPLAEVLASLPPLEQPATPACREAATTAETATPASQRLRHVLAAEFQRLDEESEQLAAMLHEVRARCRRIAGRLRRQGTTPGRSRKIETAVEGELATVDRLAQQVNRHHRFWLLLQGLTLKGLKYCNRIRHQLRQAERQGASWSRRARLRLAWFQVATSAQLKALNAFQKLIKPHTAFLTAEGRLLESGATPEELFTFYVRHDKIRLAHRLLPRLPSSAAARGDICLGRGIVAGVLRQAEEQESWFERAQRYDPGIAPAVAEARQRLGHWFLAASRECPALKIDHSSALRLLGDGLLFGGDHGGCADELRRHAESDAANLPPALEDHGLRHRAATVNAWGEILEQHPRLASEIPAPTLGRLLLARGRLLLLAGRAADALPCLRKACQLLPEEGRAVLALAQALIQTGAHAEGVAALDKAVALDRSCGYYWETLGDTLLAAGLPQDAAAAYERGFLALPEHAAFLRKMGDCYQAAGQPAAAAEAYRHFRQRSAPQAAAAASP